MGIGLTGGVLAAVRGLFLVPTTPSNALGGLVAFALLTVLGTLLGFAARNLLHIRQDAYFDALIARKQILALPRGFCVIFLRYLRDYGCETYLERYRPDPQDRATLRCITEEMEAGATSLLYLFFRVRPTARRLAKRVRRAQWRHEKAVLNKRFWPWS